MSTALKIGVGCLVALVVFGLLAAGGGYYWWKNYGAGMVEGVTRSVEEAETFGRAADEAKCVSEALARYQREPGLGAAISTRIFLEGCLQESSPAAGFCEGVPRRAEFSRSGEWRRERCEQAGLGRDQYCPQLFEGVQEYCDSDRARNKQRAAATPDWGDATPTPTPRRPARRQ